jgi:hypothetical protein
MPSTFNKKSFGPFEQKNQKERAKYENKVKAHVQINNKYHKELT